MHGSSSRKRESEIKRDREKEKTTEGASEGRKEKVTRMSLCDKNIQTHSFWNELLIRFCLMCTHSTYPEQMKRKRASKVTPWCGGYIFIQCAWMSLRKDHRQRLNHHRKNACTRERERERGRVRKARKSESVRMAFLSRVNRWSCSFHPLENVEPLFHHMSTHIFRIIIWRMFLCGMWRYANIYVYTYTSD